MHMPVSLPFDQMAAEYDRTFTHTRIGRRMREAVWQRLDVHFGPGDHVLELNCGTGEDAVHLGRRGVHVLATDISPAMVQIAQEKVERARLSEWVEVRCLAIEDIAVLSTRYASALDGVLSNFGGLNCVPDLKSVAEGLASCLRSGGVALLCLMGRWCPWEWLWFLAHRQPPKAFRRWGGIVSWRGMNIYYPSIREVRRAFAPRFRLRRVSAIGALLPPPFAESWVARHPRLLACLDQWERRLETIPPLPILADHYLLEMERVS
jgi:SAM-dependent methyltransferase